MPPAWELGAALTRTFGPPWHVELDAGCLVVRRGGVTQVVANVPVLADSDAVEIIGRAFGLEPVTPPEQASE